MGEVYRARDTRLGRDVALKVLPADFAADPGRRQRFEQEARAVAALNHPNIVAIYDVGDNYLVTELVDGESLRGAKLNVRKIVDVGAQIAGGLAAAHAAGIVHRDLKPENILLTREGRAKILDFGLAKMHTAKSAAATETVTVATEPGVVMGTVGYMSPEQVRALEVDHRSDIFSFGVILHELLGGKRVFPGDTSVEIMTAILKHDAPDLPESVPAQLRQIVARCLEKEPASRFQSARDLGFALTQSTSYSGQAPKVVQRRSWKWPAIAAACVVVGLAAGWFLRRAPEAVEWTGVMIGGPEMAMLPRLSPDGHLLAFEAMVEGMTQVAVMKPESGNWQVLTHRRDLRCPTMHSWSPDGSLIYYDRVSEVPAGVFSVPVLGGDERLVLEKASLVESLPDGSLIVWRINAQREYQTYRFWPDSGRLQDLPFLVDAVSNTATAARILPGGKQVLIAARPRTPTGAPMGLYRMDLATTAVQPLTHEAGFGNLGWSLARDGKSVLAVTSGGSMSRVTQIPLSGGPVPRTLFTAANEIWWVEGGLEGSVYANLVDRPGTLIRASPDGKVREKLGTFPDESLSIAMLPDGRAIVSTGASGRLRLLALEKGKEPVPLINSGEDAGPYVTPVGSHEIAFTIGHSPSDTIAIADTASGRIERKISPGKGIVATLAASPDGTTLYVTAGSMVWAIPSAGGEPKKICAAESAIVEPPGRNLVVARGDASRTRLYRVPLDGGPEREIPIDHSVFLYASPLYLTPGAVDAHGRLLVSLSPHDSWFNPPGILDLATGKITVVPTDGLSDHHSFVWTPDGQILTQAIGLRAAIWHFRR